MIIAIFEAILISVLVISLTFKTICVKTISDNYMNITITNQIIDFVIDNYTNITNNQLKSLQNDLTDSKELYKFNEQAFDQAISNIEVENDLNIDDETIKNFSVTCIELISKNLDRELNDDEKLKIEKLLKQDLLWTRFSQNLKTKINSESLFVKLYHISNMWIFRIVIIFLILLGILFIFIKAKDFIVICFLIITLLSSLLNYLLLIVVHLLTPLFANLLGLETLVIYMDLILYIAMGFLITSLILFLFGILKKNDKE